MAESIEAVALRATDTMIISTWWDAPTGDHAISEWLNIRSYKTDDAGATINIKTVRLSRKEALRLVEVIQNG